MQAQEPTPIRRRRRPLSSCEQCRRRKVKCDQKTPCSQCIRSKSDACTYLPFKPRDGGHNAMHSTSSVSPFSGHSLLPSEPQAREHELTFPIKDQLRRIMPSEHHSSSVQHHPFTSPGTPTPSSSSLSVEQLADRIKDLEHQLASAQLPSSPARAKGDPSDSKLKGIVSKTRLHGRSHFMYIVEKSHLSVLQLRTNLEPHVYSDVIATVDRCKKLARAIKASQRWDQSIASDLKSCVPAMDMCKGLVDAYLRTFETVHRILHIPTFTDELARFWDNPVSASEPFIIKLLLVCAIGACFQRDIDLVRTFRPQGSKWIHIAHTWLTFPFAEKSRLSTTGIQIHCLLLIARQLYAAGSDLICISTSGLVRAATLIGLHRDPAEIPRLSVFDGEIRRRLWATVLELSFQASLGSGSPPLVTANDYDTQPPRNINDDQLDPNTEAAPVPKATSTKTQTSIQLLLLRTLGLRTQVIAALNDLKTDLTHSQTIRLGTDLHEMYQQVSRQVDAWASSPRPPTQFQCLMLRMINVGSLVALHVPFALKAQRDPAYYFSRKFCTDAAMSIFIPNLIPAAPDEIPDEETSDRRNVMAFGSGIFRTIPLQSSLIVASELFAQVDEAPSFDQTTQKAVRGELYKVVSYYADHTLKCLEASDTNVKGHMFSKCMLAVIKAKEDDTPVGMAMALSVPAALERCQTVLESRLVEVGARTPSAGSEVDLQRFAGPDFVDPFQVNFWWDDMDYTLPDADLAAPWVMS